MATLKLDYISTLEATEVHGVTVRLIRIAKLTGLVATDYQVLKEALDTAGVPVAGDSLTGQVNLVLTERMPKVIDTDKVEVTLLYEHFMNHGQDFNAPYGGKILGRMTANIQQVTSIYDEDDEEITVSYKYAEDDPAYPEQVVEQAAEIQYYRAQKTLRIQGIKPTSRPWQMAREIVASINAAPWSGDDKWEWMCTAADWEPYDGTAGSNKFMMTFEFQHDPDTWNPTAKFTDPRTGRAPKDLQTQEEADEQPSGEDQVGIKQIRKHKEVDFNAIVGGANGKILGG